MKDLLPLLKKLKDLGYPQKKEVGVEYYLHPNFKWEKNVSPTESSLAAYAPSYEELLEFTIQLQIQTTSKRCPRCKKVKNLESEFGRDSPKRHKLHNKIHYQVWCRTCRSESSLESIKKRKIREKSTQKNAPLHNLDS